ncbi:phage tail protein [Aneurinibacillus aneurinilyticus]|uniref:phage tail protein n=1 Tax=Aneurinibacillus aneurinilyticus TaxID=1391 RepID=UPI002E24FA5E|nr:phage tail protein [Aneurinibacillus aneurinilyticus]
MSFIENTKGGSSVPAGAVMHFATKNPPKGWLKANGEAISRTQYADLFTVIGTTFGNGDGSTTFNLPDLRGEFIRGFDDERGVDKERIFGSWQEDELKSHNHNLAYRLRSGEQGPLNQWVAESFNGSGYYDKNKITQTGGYETRPRNVSLLACIKY